MGLEATRSDPPGVLGVTVADLAPGDARSASYDWSGAEVYRIHSPADPRFAAAYGRLWEEFGARGEMERRAVIEARLAWQPARSTGSFAFFYEMLAVEREGKLVAVRDHTAIVRRTPAAAPRIVVHLSHVLVEPGHRGTGLAGWLRALPLATARRCASASGEPSAGPIVLAAEMEPADARFPARAAHLRSYQRAGFLVVDPARAPHLQPDFRSPEEIDASSLRPVSLALVLRRVGAEAQTAISGAELRRIVEALYAMYGQHCRAEDMRPLWAHLERLPDGDEPVPLLAPTR